MNRVYRRSAREQLALFDINETEYDEVFRRQLPSAPASLAEHKRFREVTRSLKSWAVSQDVSTLTVSQLLTAMHAEPANPIAVRLGTRSRWLSNDLQSLVALINDSREILDRSLELASEGENLPISESTWIRATNFLLDAAELTWRSWGFDAELPSIDPGPLGSVDLYWETSRYRLLINIPVDPDSPIGFYGENATRRDSVKGKIEPETDSSWLFRWMRAQ